MTTFNFKRHVIDPDISSYKRQAGGSASTLQWTQPRQARFLSHE